MEHERVSVAKDNSGDETANEHKQVFDEGLAFMARLLRAAIVEDGLTERHCEANDAEDERELGVSEGRATYVNNESPGTPASSEAGNRWLERLLDGERVSIDEQAGWYTVEWVADGAQDMPVFGLREPDTTASVL